MAAEAVSSFAFRDALLALPEGKRIEVEFALYAIEDDVSAEHMNRQRRPDGLIADGSVDDYLIIYRVVDNGAAVEVVELLDAPGHRAMRPGRTEPYNPFM